MNRLREARSAPRCLERVHFRRDGGQSKSTQWQNPQESSDRQKVDGGPYALLLPLLYYSGTFPPRLKAPINFSLSFALSCSPLVCPLLVPPGGRRGMAPSRLRQSSGTRLGVVSVPSSSPSPLRSEERTRYKALRTFTRIPGPDSGPDCLVRAEFGRLQILLLPPPLRLGRACFLPWFFSTHEPARVGGGWGRLRGWFFLIFITREGVHHSCLLSAFARSCREFHPWTASGKILLNPTTIQTGNVRKHRRQMASSCQLNISNVDKLDAAWLQKNLPASSALLNSQRMMPFWFSALLYPVLLLAF